MNDIYERHLTIEKILGIQDCKVFFVSFTGDWNKLQLEACMRRVVISELTSEEFKRKKNKHLA